MIVAWCRSGDLVESHCHFDGRAVGQLTDRVAGQSKLGLSDIVEFIINAWWIRFYYSRTFIKFGIVGVSGIVVNVGFFSLFLQAGWNKYLASPIAIEISIISNFLLNNYWTFRWRDPGDTVTLRGLKFNAVSVLTLLVSYTTFVTLTWFMPDRTPLVPQLLSVVPSAMVNYFLNSYWTFGNRVDEADATQDGDTRSSR